MGYKGWVVAHRLSEEGVEKRWNCIDCPKCGGHLLCSYTGMSEKLLCRKCNELFIKKDGEVIK
jgi:hypothetical protein